MVSRGVEGLMICYWESDMDEDIQLIEDCEDRESRLSEWEAGFIQSIREQISRGKHLTSKQQETLTRVWEKVTTRG